MAENTSRDELRRLAHKWKQGTLIEAEAEALARWDEAQRDEILNLPDDSGGPEAVHDRMYAKVFDTINNENAKQSRSKRLIALWPKMAAAASILLLLSFGIWYLNLKNNNKNKNVQDNLAHAIKPGSNGAVLTLANGQQIVLEQQHTGQVTRQNGAQLSKAGDSLLVYQATATKDELPISYNTLETPKGRQYAVILPDGTKAWLNAASSLKYPTAFRGSERVVELTGEAWFSVKHDASQPFKVKTQNQTVEDIGTEFNINAYSDEAAVRTTLLEGSASVSIAQQSITLKPGQQTLLKDNHLTPGPANTEQASAWRNGYFVFESESIQPIMRKIARWYNVEIVYQGEAPEDQFWGTVSRFDGVDKVLSKLELTKKVHFTIEGRRIIVSK
ncbi:MAG: FecR family protein [Mucilaginibacter sp.]|nr:FecR family protein [Mucilaginibacter sp.]